MAGTQLLKLSPAASHGIHYQEAGLEVEELGLKLIQLPDNVPEVVGNSHYFVKKNSVPLCNHVLDHASLVMVQNIYSLLINAKVG